LPVYKRHRIGGKTSVVTRTVPEIPVVTPSSLPEVPDPPVAEVFPDVVDEVELDDGTHLSRHYELKRAELDKWASIRCSLQHAACDTAAPTVNVCQLCRNSVEFCFGCEGCVVAEHKFRQFHLLEMWKVLALKL